MHLRIVLPPARALEVKQEPHGSLAAFSFPDLSVPTIERSLCIRSADARQRVADQHIQYTHPANIRAKEN